MNDKMIPIRGYFKVDKIVDGEVVDTYEDNNTIMARIPNLFAGVASGYYQRDVGDYIIGCIALGTGGLEKDTLGNEIPKRVRDDRTSLFSEFDFWDTPRAIANDGLVNPDETKRRVYQMTFNMLPRGDLGQNTSTSDAIEPQNEGSTIPHTNWVPDSYRGTVPAEPADGLTGEMSLRQNVIQYNFTLGQFAGNDVTDNAIGYNEAALYLKLNSDLETEGKPLGTLFSMKTFPSQFKNSTCSLKIEWKLFF